MSHSIGKQYTLSPHAYNSFKNFYPSLGGNFEVFHYTHILLQFIKGLDLKALNLKVTYHDPCYLGRHNGDFNTVRAIIKAIPGVELVEMDRTKRNAFCCGGGGGNFFTDILGAGYRSPAYARVEEAVNTEADVLIVACPILKWYPIFRPPKASF